MRSAIQLVTPLPPQPSGIAQYSRDLLEAAPDTWPLRVFAESGSDAGQSGGFPVRPWRAFDADLPTILQLGNSAHHRGAFAVGRKTHAIAVLHDVILHHALLVEFIRRNDGRGYVRLMQRRYGDAGGELARAALRGHVPGDLLAWPLSEPYVERSRAVIVHNAFAEAQVLERNAGANVFRVAMGIPLPRLIEQGDARDVLRLPRDAFIIASVTHINPYKRMGVVLRAIRRLAARLPELVFVVAGSVSPDIDLERQNSLLGLGSRVRLLGYVDDATARLVARAADVCINLRHPVTGETSASLLRLLGAGRPVVVSGGPASADLPIDVGLRVAPDRFEEEMLVELLFALAVDDDFRAAAGTAGRAFIEQEHTMQVAIQGYRKVIDEVYGLTLDRSDRTATEERIPTDEWLNKQRRPTVPLVASDAIGWRASVTDAVGDLRLGDHEPTLHRIAQGIVGLGIDGDNMETDAAEALLDEEFVALLACPVCKGTLRQEPGTLACVECGREYPVVDGIPNLLAIES